MTNIVKTLSIKCLKFCKIISPYKLSDFILLITIENFTYQFYLNKRLYAFGMPRMGDLFLYFIYKTCHHISPYTTDIRYSPEGYKAPTVRLKVSGTEKFNILCSWLLSKFSSGPPAPLITAWKNWLWEKLISIFTFYWIKSFWTLYLRRTLHYAIFRLISKSF